MTPLKVVLVGAGSMGLAWRDTIEATPHAELVGIADLDLAVARDAAAGLATPIPVGDNAVELARATGATAIVNVTVPEAHHEVATAAMFAGLDVLGEKPVADTVPKALSLAAAAEATGRMLMVSQSRRWNPQLFALRSMVEDLGAVGSLTTEFFRAPRFGGFRERMAHPLLVDMAIHAFDSARYLLGAEPVAAYCEAYNPPWSWFDGAASASAVFTMEGGARYSYTGSWCAPGTETSWNGVWRVSGEKGSASWDGDHDPVLHAPFPPADRPLAAYSGIAGALEVFVDALASGSTPMGEVHENLLSLVMVEAAVRSAETGERVLIDDVLDRAYAEALAAETHPDVRAALAAWPSPRAALTGP